MSHPQRTAKYSSAIDKHDKEFSVTGAEFTITYWDIERDLGWVVGVVVLEGVPPTGGFTSISTFYEFYAGRCHGCELTTDEAMSKRCTHRCTREMIFNDAPRSYSGYWATGSKSKYFSGSGGARSVEANKGGVGGCNLNNAYSLRMGMFTSEYGPGTPRSMDPKERGFKDGRKASELVVPYFSPYVPDANGNMPTPVPTTPPTPGPTMSQSTCPTFDNNYDYMGNDAMNLDRISSAGSCSVSCAERMTGYFSYSPSRKKCWCKRSSAGRKPRGDRVSGVASKACGARR
jgi:hypothetical protein